MVKIIVADDEPTHLELVATILERAGHDVIAVASGYACLHQLRSDGVDLVVADIFMPDLDGLQMMALMRNNGTRIPVIAMTGGMKGQLSSFTDIMSRLGARSILTKPFSAHDLLSAVQSSVSCGTVQEL